MGSRAVVGVVYTRFHTSRVSYFSLDSLITACFRGDETRNGHRDTQRNPRSSKFGSLFK